MSRSTAQVIYREGASCRFEAVELSNEEYRQASTDIARVMHEVYQHLRDGSVPVFITFPFYRSTKDKEFA